MGLLTFVWSFALSLAAISFLGMAMLLVSRPVAGLRARRIATSRGVILQVLVNADVPESRLRRHVARAARLGTLAPIILEALAVVRGPARKCFLDPLTQAGAARALRECLASGKSRDRRCAAEALAAFAPFESQAALQAAWWDTDSAVRFAAIRASIEIEAPPAFIDVVEIARHAQRRDHAPALGLVRLMAAKFPSAACAAIVESSLPAFTRIALIEGVASTTDAGVIDALAAASQDPDPLVRCAATLAVGAWPGPIGLAIVVQGLNDGVWMVRANAAISAGKARLMTCAPLLRLLLFDSHWWVRIRASEALQRLAASQRKVSAA